MVELTEFWTECEQIWYTAEHARSGRSACKECFCTIDKDTLRIGIEQGENDHYGAIIGWYHPACLFQSMDRATNANKRITQLDDIKNYQSLLEEDKAAITALIAANTLAVTPSAKLRQPKKRGRNDEAPTDEAPGADGEASTRFPVPVESVCSLEECDARTLETLCKARGVAHSGTKAARIARIEADMLATPCPDDVAYRKQVYSLISAGRVQAKGREAADLPWNHAGEKV